MRMVTEKDVLIAVLPFFHIYANTAILGIGLIKGAKIVVMPKFDFVQFLEALQNYKVTFAHIVPPIALALAKHPLVAKVFKIFFVNIIENHLRNFLFMVSSIICRASER